MPTDKDVDAAGKAMDDAWSKAGGTDTASKSGAGTPEIKVYSAYSEKAIADIVAMDYEDLMFAASCKQLPDLCCLLGLTELVDNLLRLHGRKRLERVIKKACDVCGPAVPKKKIIEIDPIPIPGPFDEAKKEEICSIPAAEKGVVL